MKNFTTYRDLVSTWLVIRLLSTSIQTMSPPLVPNIKIFRFSSYSSADMDALGKYFRILNALNNPYPYESSLPKTVISPSMKLATITD